MRLYHAERDLAHPERVKKGTEMTRNQAAANS